MPPTLQDARQELEKRAKEMQAVSAERLAAPTEPVKLPEPMVAEPNDRMDIVDQVRNQVSFDVDQFRADQKTQREQLEQLQSLGEEGTLAEFYQQELERMEVPQNIRTLTDIQQQLADRKTESLGRQSDIARIGGITTANAGRAISAERARENVRSYGLAAQAAVLQGNIQTATTLVNQAVQTAYQDRQLRNQNLINQINTLKGIVDPQRAEILQKEQRMYEEDQAEIKRIQAAVDTAISSGAANAEEVATLTKELPPQEPGETFSEYRNRVESVDREKYRTALDIVARQARQAYQLELGIKQRQYDKLGIEIESAHQKALQAIEDAKNGVLSPEKMELATQLRKEYNGQQEVKDAKNLEASTASLIAALEQENGTGDISAINAFQRLVVDPGVAVREGDVALLQSAQSYTDVATLKAQGLWKGDKLTPTARQQMKSLVKDVYRIRVELVEMNTENIRTTAQESGIDFGRYIGRNFQTFEQLQANVTPQEQVEFGIDTTDSYLDNVDAALRTDPSANPFGVSLQ